MYANEQSLYSLAVPFINGGGRSRPKKGKGGGGGMGISQFMNRILALKVDVQHDVFGFFEQVRPLFCGTGARMSRWFGVAYLLTRYILTTTATHRTQPPHAQIHHQLIHEGKVSGHYDSGVSDIYAEKVLDAQKNELLQLDGASCACARPRGWTPRNTL